MILFESTVPVTSIPCPTNKLLVTLAPPTVLILPVSRSVAFVVDVTINPSLTTIFPVTSNASVGLVLLTPILVLVTVITFSTSPDCVFNLTNKLFPAVLL